MAQVSHGYPDFNRVVSQSDVLFLNVFNDTISAPKTYPLGYIGNLPYLGVSYDGAGQRSRVEIDFYADANFAILLTPFAFDIADGGNFGGAVPIGGPFAQVTITPAGANLAYDIDVWSAPAEFGVFAARPTDNVLLSASGQSIGAGGNTTFAATHTAPASVVLCVSTTAVAWVGHLLATDYLGATTHIHFFTPGVTQYNQPVYLPAMPVSLNLKNNDAGAKLFDFSLIARPWSPGR